jgi:hypothetical protein
MRRLAQLLSTALIAFGFTGCGPGAAKISGKVTCDGKPVRGSIMFSPAGEGPENTGPAVAAPLKDDGTFELEIKTIGKHKAVVSPSDVKFPAKPGEEFPCDLSAVEKELKPGPNTINLELQPNKK